MIDEVNTYTHKLIKNNEEITVTITDKTRYLHRSTRIENTIIELHSQSRRIIVRLYRYLGNGFTHHRESVTIIEDDELKTYGYRDIEGYGDRIHIDETPNHDNDIDAALDTVSSILREPTSDE